jgi:hypothetical protein
MDETAGTQRREEAGMTDVSEQESIRRRFIEIDLGKRCQEDLLLKGANWQPRFFGHHWSTARRDLVAVALRHGDE